MINPFLKKYPEINDEAKMALLDMAVKAGELFAIFESINQAYQKSSQYYNREITVAKHKLEEAVMWAKKAITEPNG